MTSDFAITSTSYASSFDERWRASSHGADAGETGTLELATLTAFKKADGTLPSGIAVGEITATPGHYGLFDTAATDGRQILAGFINADVSITNAAGTVQPSGLAPFSLFNHGSIKRSVLPVVAQRTAITYTVASRGQFVFVD